MSPRWKFQLRHGGIWGALMILCITLLDLFMSDEAFDWRELLIRTVVFLAGGIFVVGYYSWKAKLQKESKNNS